MYILSRMRGYIKSDITIISNCLEITM